MAKSSTLRWWTARPNTAPEITRCSVDSKTFVSRPKAAPWIPCLQERRLHCDCSTQLTHAELEGDHATCCQQLSSTTAASVCSSPPAAVPQAVGCAPPGQLDLCTNHLRRRNARPTRGRHGKSLLLAEVLQLRWQLAVVAAVE